MIYTFNSFQIDTENFVLKNIDTTIDVEPRVFDLIIYLIENKSKVVTRDELFKVVWKGRDVLDATLSNHIKSARNVLGDDGQTQKVIKTIHGRGYQFVAEVSDTPNNSDDLSSKTYKKYLFSLALLGILAVVIFVLVKNSAINETKLPTRTIDNKSIAVLAFLDMSPDQDHAYFSEGMSEEILNKLTHIPELRVISRTSSFYFKDKGLTAEEIGKQLNVSHLLEGSVRKHNDKVRITVQLIETITSNHLWSQTYDRTMNDIFKTQDEIAQAVSKKLKVSLVPKIHENITVNLEAYTEYLKAKHLSQTNTRENNKESELIIRKSIALDPNYAPAWQFLAKTVFKLTFNFGMRTTNDGFKTSTFAVNKAIALNSGYAPSYATLARIQSQQRDFIASDKSMEKALNLNSNDSYILSVAAKNAMFSGNLDQALNYRSMIEIINPKYYSNYYGIGLVNYLLNNQAGAYSAFEKYAQAKPDADVFHYLMCSVSLVQGKNQQALAHANKEKNKFWKLYARVLALFAVGNNEQADVLFEQFIGRYQNSDLANIARIYAFRGEFEKSFEWLDKAFKHLDSTLIQLLQNPDFKELHDDSRWHELIKKMNFPASHWLVKQLPGAF